MNLKQGRAIEGHLDGKEVWMSKAEQMGVSFKVGYWVDVND